MRCCGGPVGRAKMLSRVVSFLTGAADGGVQEPPHCHSYAATGHDGGGGTPAGEALPEGDANLDLCYVTRSVIAMGYAHAA